MARANSRASSNAMRRPASHLMRAQKARARAHPEMERIARRFAAINGSLAKGVQAGSVTRAQLRSIGRNFAAIGRELQK